MAVAEEDPRMEYETEPAAGSTAATSDMEYETKQAAGTKKAAGTEMEYEDKSAASPEMEYEDKKQ